MGHVQQPLPTHTRDEIALIGNPNIGKTSLFNILTDSYAYIGNWSGVTVEKKCGTLRKADGQLLDLPGTYSLHPLSEDEAIVMRYLLEGTAASFLNIVNAAQLVRNLYLTVQLLEYGKPVIIALNMMDVAERDGVEVDVQKLSRVLRTPVFPIVARTGKGVDALEAALGERVGGQFGGQVGEQVAGRISERVHAWTQPAFRLDYGVLEPFIARVEKLLPSTGLSPRWVALQLLEGNDAVFGYDKQLAALRPAIAEIVAEAGNELSDDVTDHIRAVRKQFVDSVLADAVCERGRGGPSLTDRLDALAMNRYVGIPIFFLLMFLMFKATFDWIGGPLSDGLEDFINGAFSDWVTSALQALAVTPFMQDLIVDGIIAGVGGVLVFFPQIFTLFFFISVFEDSGYMSRVAVVMDRLLEKVGLGGKSFIPMIIGFGCNVPAVMAARTIEHPKERLLTVLLTPLMSCSARLSIYTLFTVAFFRNHQAEIVFSLYVLGIVVALILAKLFSVLMFRQEKVAFIVELPPYRLPHAKTLLRSAWDKGKGFLRKAGTFIFAGSVVIWLLAYSGPGGLDVPIDDSFLAMIGGAIAPLMAPLGFGTWQAAAALLTGFLAKEVVVSTMNIIYAAPSLGALRDVLASQITPLGAYSFLVFTLLYVPCLATVAVIHRETGRQWKWTIFSIVYALVVAYLLSLLVYIGGGWLGFQ